MFELKVDIIIGEFALNLKSSNTGLVLLDVKLPF